MKHFINLTDGLEWADELPEFSFVRIESTAIEKEAWDRILRDLDANLLMNLAMGEECHFYDCGANREVSKTVSVGIPFIVKTLYDFWLGETPYMAKTPERQAVKRKIGYFRRFVNTDQIKLIGHSRKTINDGNKPYFQNIAVSLYESQNSFG